MPDLGHPGRGGRCAPARRCAPSASRSIRSTRPCAHLPSVLRSLPEKRNRYGLIPRGWERSAAARADGPKTSWSDYFRRSFMTYGSLGFPPRVFFVGFRWCATATTVVFALPRAEDVREREPDALRLVVAMPTSHPRQQLGRHATNNRTGRTRFRPARGNLANERFGRARAKRPLLPSNA
jgi:hypothetical protein